MKTKIKYYSLQRILAEKADYNIIIGERSNGKTYAVKDFILKRFFENKEQGAIIRRMDTDFEHPNTFFNDSVDNGLIAKYSKGEWDRVVFLTGNWYFARYDEELKKLVYSVEPFCYKFALSRMEHYKSHSYPNVTNILFDEFLSRTGYLPDEFIIFQNMLSTIIRQRDNVKIFMCANTVNKYSIYYEEMGLTNIEKMQEGDIDVYTYGDSGLEVAVEFAVGVVTNGKRGKKSDKYFAFNNPKLKMITRGTWEISVYPHLPMKYENRDISFYYFIEFNKKLLQCEIITVNDVAFTYIHTKTTPFRKPTQDIIFSPEYSERFNRRRKITEPYDDIGKIIYSFFKSDKVFFQTNDVGEIVRNYLLWCQSDKGLLN